jgi:serine phosphatase RsbU (regulator of sigma subunit)
LGYGPLALLIYGGQGTYEVYWNGHLLPGPRIQSPISVTYPRSQIVPLPVASGEAIIALRTFIPPTSMFVADRGSFRVALGSLLAVHDAHRAESSARLYSILPGMGIYFLLLFAGVPLLALFWYQPDHREYMWLGVYLIADAVDNVSFNLSSSGFAPFSGVWFACTPLNYVMAIAIIEFAFGFVGQRVTRMVRLYELAIIAWPLAMLLPAWSGLMTRDFFNMGEMCLLIPVCFVVPFLLLGWYRRGQREAGWLILPSILPVFSLALSDIGVLGQHIGSRTLAILVEHFRLGSISTSICEIADFLFLLAIGIVMFFRFTRVSREQARTAAELNAARDIQQRLVPHAVPRLAGYALEASYLPAQEVGGDFYQILGQSDGATLIVVGDVSGKGLKAAMTGTLAIGALRTLAAEGLHPATLLARLNQQILSAQNDGFITCLCARIESDGSVVLANAGHLSPYLNGKEIGLSPGLPLGITPDVEYTETALQLLPTDSVTFLSDGVVEAQSSTGELFGFDRTAAISTQSAESIAHAAQAHGQEDDITVLTLTFAPAEVAHA